MADFDNEIIQDFILESREHLSSVEPDLLTLEGDSDQVDSEIINRVFRAIHSIKGASGFFDLNQINKLSHVMENLLMQLRDGKMLPSADLIDALLAGTDKLSSMIDDVEASEDIDMEEEIENLSSFLSDEKKKTKSQKKKSAKKETKIKEPVISNEKEGDIVSSDTNKKLFDTNEDDIRVAKANGKYIFVIHVDYEEDLENENRALGQLVEAVEKVGSVFSTIPAYEKGKKFEKPDNGEILILAGSVLEKDLLAMGIDLPEDCIIEYNADYVKVDKPPKTIDKSEKVDDEPEEKLVNDVSATPAKATQKKKSEKAAASLDTLRVNVGLLNNLMDLAGELVLGRNQLMQTVSSSSIEVPGLNSVLQHLDLVTGEMQENIMMTRMQQVGNVFNKFPRIIRDLSRKMNKEIELELKGNEVELDKSIIESLSDPLTHLIRNTADHGIETAEGRKKAGKPSVGHVLLRAYHEAGMVNIEIVDDGRGMDAEVLKAKAVEKKVISLDEAEKMSDKDAYNLIFAPGFSTAAKITDVSGRGVGMDVVKTNIEKLGGTVEIESTFGKGTRVNLRLPLTLAIIPSLIVDVSGEKFAIPQVNIEELVRIRAKDAHKAIERVNGADVFRLRDLLLPLVKLDQVMDIEPTFIHPETGERLLDRRKLLADRRAKGDGREYNVDLETGALSMPEGYVPVNDEELAKRDPNNESRRWHRASAVTILVLKVLDNRFGLVVDTVMNNEEIVVKPLSQYVKENTCYAGTTIMGDGSVAMILDAQGIAEDAKLKFSDLDRANQMLSGEGAYLDLRETLSTILFTNGSAEMLGLPLQMITRIEKVRVDEIEKIGDKEYIQYRGGSLRLIRLEDHLPVSAPDEEKEFIHVIVPKMTDTPVGIIAANVVDVVDEDIEFDSSSIESEGVLGSAIIQDKITLILDTFNFLENVDPEIYETKRSEYASHDKARLLLADDTPFLKNMVSTYLNSANYMVDTVTNGQEAIDKLKENSYDMIISDLKMPVMDGYELVKTIKNAEEFKNIPVLALSSDESEDRDQIVSEFGFDYCSYKMDKMSLLKAVSELSGKEL